MSRRGPFDIFHSLFNWLSKVFLIANAEPEPEGSTFSRKKSHLLTPSALFKIFHLLKNQMKDIHLIVLGISNCSACLVQVLSSFTLVGWGDEKRCTIFSNNQPRDDTRCIILNT